MLIQLIAFFATVHWYTVYNYSKSNGSFIYYLAVIMQCYIWNFVFEKIAEVFTQIGTKSSILYCY